MFMKDKRLCILRLDWNERDSFLPIGMSLVLLFTIYDVLFDSM